MSDYFKAPVIVGETPGEKVQRLEADLAAATLARDEAVKALTRSTTILHVMCHSAYDDFRQCGTVVCRESAQTIARLRSTEATPAVEGQG